MQVLSKTKIKLLFCGDFFVNYKNENLMLDENKMFNNFLSCIKGADLSVVNFEGTVRSHAQILKKTGPILEASPSSIKVLAKSGFNLLTLANNHIMDLGRDGMENTIKVSKSANLEVTGIGYSLNEARKPFYTKIKNKRIAVLNFAENEFSIANENMAGANPLNLVNNYYDIKTAKSNADFVIVVAHGGHEGYSLPSPRMKNTYRFFIDAGADAVIGHHTHCFSGFETYGSAPIFYSLGNFVFDWEGTKNTNWDIGYAVSLELSDQGVVYELKPYKQIKNKLGIELLNKTENEKFYESIYYLNSIIQNDKLLYDNFSKFCSSISKSYLSYLEPHSLRLFHALRNRGFFPSFLSKRKKMYLLNLIRCESHRDIVIELLDGNATCNS